MFFPLNKIFLHCILTCRNLNRETCPGCCDGARTNEPCHHHVCLLKYHGGWGDVVWTAQMRRNETHACQRKSKWHRISIYIYQHRTYSSVTSRNLWCAKDIIIILIVSQDKNKKVIVGLHIWEDCQDDITKTKVEPSIQKHQLLLSHLCFLCLLTSFFSTADRFFHAVGYMAIGIIILAALVENQNIISPAPISVSEKENHQPRIAQFSLL